MKYAVDKARLYKDLAPVRDRLFPDFPCSLPLLTERVKKEVSNLHILSRQMDSERMAGLLMRGPEQSVIVLNAGRSEKSRLFTLAHELVHFYLHTGQRQFFCTDGSDLLLERQANEGASELLVPYTVFLKEQAAYGALLKVDYEKGLQKLADRFGVSKTVIRIRFSSLSRELVAYSRGVPIEEITLCPLLCSQSLERAENYLDHQA